MGLLTLIFFFRLLRDKYPIRQEQRLDFAPPLTCKSPVCDPGVALWGPILEMLSTARTQRVSRTLQYQIPADLQSFLFFLTLATLYLKKYPC